MSRKIRIASMLVLAVLACASGWSASAALAGGPLLSGYGGPGAGEQAIVGSTFLNGGGRGGGSSSGSGGSSEAGGSGSAGGSAQGSSDSSSAGADESLALSEGSQRGTAAGSAGQAGGGTGSSGSGSHAARTSGKVSADLDPRLYPASLRSASDDSSTLGLSATDLLVFLAVLATLCLIGVLTIRLVRLQA